MPPILSSIRAWRRFRRAEGALGRGDFQAAFDGFADALAFRPSPAARVKLGLAQWETGARREGASRMREGVKDLPEAHPLRLFLALVDIEEGRLDEGRAVLEAVRSADPENLFCLGLASLAHLHQGSGREAAGALVKGVFGSPLFRAHLLVAVEKHLKATLKPEAWAQAYLETVL